MCSKKWANPDFPASNSLREPVCTGICRETMLGNPVGTTMTLRPLARVFSVALKGSTWARRSAVMATERAAAARRTWRFIPPV